MNILLTGGSGFIGRNILEHLGPKYNILAPSRKELDLTDEEQVKAYLAQHQIDVIIHGAVKPGHRNARDPSNLLYNNTRMFFNLVRNLDRVEKMIFLSSGAVYDMRHYQPKMKEEYFDTHVPADEHGFSKYIAGKYIEQCDKIIELRLFGVFGPYEDYVIRFISNAICKTLFDLPITIKQNRKFDYLYVVDLMPVLEYFLHHWGKYRAYNVTPDQSIELLTLAEKVLKISGKDLPILIGQPGMGPEYSGDNSRLKEEIPNLTFTPIDQAIGELFRWYQEHKENIDYNLLLFDP